MKRETIQKLISDGCLVRNGYDYETANGVVIRRVYTGKRGTVEKWSRDGDGYLYRSLIEAYYGIRM